MKDIDSIRGDLGEVGLRVKFDSVDGTVEYFTIP